MGEIKKSDSIDQSIMQMQQALLGVAEIEEGVLKNIKAHLDQIFDNVYQRVKDLKNLATLDAMIVETPMTQIDPDLQKGLESISSELNAKNAEIIKLQRRLESLGVEVPKYLSGQSVEMLRQHLQELTKRNKNLRDIHRKLATHPFITGRIPKRITFKEVKTMLAGLEKELSFFNKANQELKKQIKSHDNKLDHDDKNIKPSGPKRR